jgi:hypothetical protein
MPKADWRRQINGAGLGQRLAKSIRAETWPKGTTSIGAAALVWSKAPAIVGAHDTGPLIRSKTGFWLAIPTPAAGCGLRWGQDHAGRVGAPPRAASALRLPPPRPEPAGRRPRPDQQARPGGGVPGKDRP